MREIHQAQQQLFVRWSAYFIGKGISAAIANYYCASTIKYQGAYIRAIIARRIVAFSTDCVQSGTYVYTRCPHNSLLRRAPGDGLINPPDISRAMLRKKRIRNFHGPPALSCLCHETCAFLCLVHLTLISESGGVFWDIG